MDFFQTYAEGVGAIASSRTWIEGAAVQQLTTTAKLPDMVRVVGMPDLHPGRGYPVGAAFFSQHRLYPALVGNDIGCGMALWSLDTPVSKARLDKLEKQWRGIEGPLDASWQDAIEAEGLAGHRHRNALGTIGGGNHFAELQKVDAVYDAEALTALGLDTRNLLLLVHSGSRGLGEAILRHHVDTFGHAGLADDSDACKDYLEAHNAALTFAASNRRLIALRTCERLRMNGKALLDVHHNMVLPLNIEGVAGWIHRKGATPADAGPVVIPGSRGDYSYLVDPIPQSLSLFSLAHGAGRKWMRSECQGRLSAKQRPDSLLRTKLGSRVICEDKSLLYEEAPEAYKPIDSVVSVLVEAGLVRLLAKLAPVMTYKTRNERCCS